MRKLAREILKRKRKKKEEETSAEPVTSPVKPLTSPKTQPRQNVQSFQGISDEELKRISEGAKPAIQIIGVGGAGGNTINRCYGEVKKVGMYALNTDAMHLHYIDAPNKLLIGERRTRGLGAGSKPKVGEHAIADDEDKVKQILMDAKMVFLTCGMGGGTGTGATPYVAKLGSDMGKLTLAIVTYPFKAEGMVRKRNADWGLEKLQEVANTVIVIQNDKLLELVPRLSLNSAFRVADEILMRSIKSLTTIITEAGLVNVDYSDVRKVMENGGLAMIGMGRSASDDRIEEAVTEALDSPLLDMDISDARAALVNVVGGTGMTVEEAEKVSTMVGDRINPRAEVIWGARIDESLERSIEVMVVLTGVVTKQLKEHSSSHPLGDIGIPFIK